MPTLVLLVLIAAWTGFWFFAAGQADAAVERMLAEQARAGREITCADRRVEGYPFRIELRCGASSLVADLGDGPLFVRASGLVVVAQLPNPTHLIAEVAGPVTLSRSEGAPDATIDFALAHASLHGRPGRLDRVSVEIGSPVLRSAGDRPDQPVFKAGRVELHLRRTPDAEPGSYDVAGSAADADGTLAQMLLGPGGPLSTELQASISHADLLAPEPTPDRLRAFAEAGGKIRLALLRARFGDAAFDANGDVALDEAGRLNGAVTITATGVDKIMAIAARYGLSPFWGTGLSALGRPGKLGDKPASTYVVSFAAGRIAVGPLPLGVAPPLF